MILLIDNYDSFTYNLVQRLGEIAAAETEDAEGHASRGRRLELRVVRNDKITADEAEAMAPTHVIISPGPCTPREAGVSPEIIRRFAGRVPVLGVCLGHQCIGDMHGMTVTRHVIPMHGKTSPIFHDGQGIFAGLPSPFVATRYHSLVVLPETVPASGWVVSAWTEEATESGQTRRVVMGLRREWGGEGATGEKPAAKAPLEGVQFHPESFLTLEGPRLLRNFLNM
jgi:anthranilate synthase/aminodeoxychorismate synthase-like glutamine amidotransferase